MSPDSALIGSPRLNYYNPKLDPRTLRTKMTPAMAEACEDGRYDDGTPESSGPLNTPDASHPYNLVSSLCEDGLHRPALDYDVRCTEHEARDAWALIFPEEVIELVASTTHWHVYVPTLPMTWPAYSALLRALAGGLVEERYVGASINRGQTLLRPPHIHKPARR